MDYNYEVILCILTTYLNSVVNFRNLSKVLIFEN